MAFGPGRGRAEPGGLARVQMEWMGDSASTVARCNDVNVMRTIRISKAY
jgi:hypothetical protein